MLAFTIAMGLTATTLGDVGLTWDEPAYRFSQLRSGQWWERLAGAAGSGNVGEAKALVEPDALLFYWTYGRHGINFHPPLAGQLNLLTHFLFGRWMGDMPSRRMASAIELSLAVALAFGFLSTRYGPWVGGLAAGSLLLLPRVFGDAHVAGTDTPGILLWPATAIAFWKGLNEPDARRWRVLAGVLVGLAFVEKMAAVFVVAPLLLWLLTARLPKAAFRAGASAGWADGLLTSSAMIAPLGLALMDILRLAQKLPKPVITDLFVERPTPMVGGWILAIPLGVWLGRRLLARVWSTSAVWGVERPGLELWEAWLAFGPLVAWLGNPAWWRETLPRLAHYYLINTDRRGSLPDIQIYYLGRTYLYSLPWANAWVLTAATVPASILLASLLGVVWAFRTSRRDPLPAFFLLQLATLPVFRMFPTPAHDGVRLFLPTFFFLAAMAGWGGGWLGDELVRRLRSRVGVRGFVAALVLLPAGWQLFKTHPYELEYYNEILGGPRGAWGRWGFELTYWYDAFNPTVLKEINARLPEGADVFFNNSKSEPMTFSELQSLGELRPDVRLGWRKDMTRFPFVWLLTQDSKASAFTKLLYTMRPWYESRPRQLDGLRAATVADPTAVSRAWALWLLCDEPDRLPPEAPTTPRWVREFLPVLRRFWGEGLQEIARPTANPEVLDWARTDPTGLVGAARVLTAGKGNAGDDAGALRLKAILDRYRTSWKASGSGVLWKVRPEALVEAAEILARRPDAVETVLTRYGYTDPSSINGALDQDLPRGVFPAVKPETPRPRP